MIPKENTSVKSTLRVSDDVLGIPLSWLEKEVFFCVVVGHCCRSEQAAGHSYHRHTTPSMSKNRNHLG